MIFRRFPIKNAPEPNDSKYKYIMLNRPQEFWESHNVPDTRL